MSDKVFDFLDKKGVILYSDRLGDFLEHHGIKGQKWGVKNGPPYPLRKEGYYDVKMDTPFKLQIKSDAKAYAISFASVIGGVGLTMATSSALPIYAAPLAALSPYLIKEIRSRTKKKETVLQDEANKEQTLKDLKKISKEERSPEKIVKEINPMKNRYGGTDNCAYCTAAFEMRSRGYDVRARNKYEGTYVTAWKNWFDGVKNVSFNCSPKGRTELASTYQKRAWKELNAELNKQPEGARGYLGMQWGGGFKGGHVLNWVRENGDVYFYDAQARKSKDASFLGCTDWKFDYARLDNLKLKPYVMQTCVGVYDDDKK